MSKTYIAANGQEITEEMIDRWCESYEKGEFPEGEHTVGSVVLGRPPLSSGEATVTLSEAPSSTGAREDSEPTQGLHP